MTRISVSCRRILISKIRGLRNGRWSLMSPTVMHFGNDNNNKFSYEMNGKVLDKVLAEKDLGIMISSDVKSSQLLCM